ncbi:MAG TPA: DCC1-like thiol-disulfide oxidoreductase family protein [Terriglobales bacterium]
MISLISEITDRKGRRAAGWVFYDGECEFCRSMARRFRSTLQKRGFGLAPLQDPRVATLLGLPPNLLPREMRVLTAEGQVLGGAQAVTFLAGKIWWAWPVHAAARLPGMPALLRAAYRWVADHRHCPSCAVGQSAENGGSRSRLKGAER